MSVINKRIAANVLLAAFEFKNGQRRKAAQILAEISEDEDFEETIDGLGQAVANGDEDMDEDGFEDDVDDFGGDDEVKASAKGKPSKAKTVKAESLEDGDSDGDTDNDNEHEMRQVNEMARTRQIRANLIALARAE